MDEVTVSESDRTLRSKQLRNALWLAARGKCQSCGRELSGEWHADHVTPWCVTRRTNVHEMQALCRECNLKKGARMLRKHQQELAKKLKEIVETGLRKTQLVINAWPGSGKSLLPVIAANILRSAGLIDRVCVVVPRLSLKRQVALAFQDARFRSMLGHRLEVMEAGNDVDPSRGTAGYVTTYQALVADAAGIHAQEFRRYRYLLVTDEHHHVGEGSEFHAALTPLWNRATFRIPMSGTLDRNEGDRIAFLDYSRPEVGGNYKPEVDIPYGLKDALRDEAVVPITFHQIDGQVEYIDRNSQRVWMGTLNTNDKETCWAAINTPGYADKLLSECVAHWKQYRAGNGRSQLLVVCASQAQARRTVKVLEGLGVSSAIATSDEANAQDIIKLFREQRTPDALVTVQMAYEGLDVPSLTHLACLTHIRSKPWLSQMFTRITRRDYEAGPYQTQHAHLWAPDDPFMQVSIDYFRNEQTIGIAELEAEREEREERERREKGDGGEGEDDTPATTIPIAGDVTRSRVSGLNGLEDLDYQQTAAVKALMQKHGVTGDPIGAANMLKEAGVNLDVLAPLEDQPARRTATPKDRERAIRDRIQKTLGRIDYKVGAEPGTMSRRCFREAQACRSRQDLTEPELLRVWEWVCRQARAAGLESEGE